MLASQIIFIFIFLFIAILGFFVLWRNPGNIINRRFCIFAEVLSVWVFFIFFLLQTTDQVAGIFRLKLVFCGAMFIPSSFFFFSSIFPDRVERSIDRYQSIIFFIISVVLSFFSSNIVASVSFKEEVPHPKYGPLFPVFWFYFIACMAYSLYSIYRKSLHYYGIKRLQVQYVYYGGALSVFIGAITNFALPILGVWQVEMFVPLVMIPFPIAVAYAIVKYHLMDISVVIKRSTVYASLSIVISGIYFTVLLILGHILPVSEYKNMITTAVSTVVVILTFVSARESIEHIIEKTLFHTKYSHPKVLSDSTVMFSSIYDLNELLRFAIQYLYDSIGIEKICILIKDAGNRQYSLRAAINFSNEDNLFLSSQNSVVTWLFQNKTVLSRDQLNRFLHGKFDQLLENTLASLNVDSCIPVMQENDLFGIILLGRKVNKKVYTQEDIQMFLAFSGQLAMAARNARLYSGLKEAKTYRENILQSLKNGIIVVDDNDEVTFINNEAKRILGLNRTNTTEIILNHFGNDTYRALRHMLNSDTEYLNIETLIDRGNKTIPCGVTASKLRTEDGQRLGALMILTDLTELKLLQTEKQHADRLAYLGTLAANIAHEVKNPLVAINTYFQLLPQKKDDLEFQSEFQKIALKEIGRINRIIEDLLDLAKPSKPVLRHMNPHNAIMDIINLLKNPADEKGVKFTIVLEEKLCYLTADEDKIRQVLINLLQNSLDAVSRNGHIKVSTNVINNLSDFRRMAKVSTGSVFFSFASPYLRDLNRQYFVIKVSDNGIGIPAQKISQIFEPFFTNKEKGTGLGLAMVYRIVQDHEGAIYVESREGEGTDFYICLPFSPIAVQQVQTKIPFYIPSFVKGD